MCVCVYVYVCSLVGILFLDLSFCASCCLLLSGPVFLQRSRRVAVVGGVRGTGGPFPSALNLPPERTDGGGSSPLLRLTSSPVRSSNVCYARPPERQLSHSLALPSLPLRSLSPFPFPILSLPSLHTLSLSRSVLHCWAPPTASLISRIRYSFKKTHSTWQRAQTTLTQRGGAQGAGREGEGERAQQREREREGERERGRERGSEREGERASRRH